MLRDAPGIYGLTDPRYGHAVRYVGKSVKGIVTRNRNRLRGIVDPDSLVPCDRWIRKLRRLGLVGQVRVEPLEYVEPLRDETPQGHRARLNDRERHWIARGRAAGWRLLNVAAGGDGGDRALCRAMWSDPDMRARMIDGIRRSAGTSEGKARRSAASKAMRARPEIKARISTAVSEMWSDPAARERMVQAQRRSWEDPGERERRREAMRHAAARSEEKARKSAAARAHMNRPDVRRANAAATAARWADPEYRERMRRAMREAWARRKNRSEDVPTQDEEAA